MSQPSEFRQTGSSYTYERAPEETATEAVVRAVADATDRSAVEMTPLADRIEPDALNAVLGSRDDAPSAVSVSFEYGGTTVYATPSRVHVDDRI